MKARCVILAAVAVMLGVFAVIPASASGDFAGDKWHKQGGAMMAAQTPEEVHMRWLEAINAGDLEALLPLYEPGATAVFGPGQVGTGTEAIRAGLAGLLALKPHFELRVAQVLPAGDLALLLSPWTMTATNPDGSPLNLTGTTSDVVRRQPDGTWRFIIDNPTGSGGI